jgi:glycosyltransferase involved in cell wall biosynthesis
MSADASRPESARKLKVSMVTRRRPSSHGGVERMVTSLMLQMAQTCPAWQVDSVSAFNDGSHFERISGLSDVIASLRLGWRLRKSTADVIFIHCPECLWGIRLLCGRRRAMPPVIAVWHGAGPIRFVLLRKPGHPLAWALAWLRFIEELQALGADGHVAVHGAVAKDLRLLYGMSKPVAVIWNGVDASILHKLSELKHETEKSSFTALWLGQTQYGKGLDVALAAMAEARKSLPGLQLLVAGVPAGSPTEGVQWCGIVPPAEIAEIYRRADVLIFPSRYEAFALVVIEAMAAGLPVIVSDSVPEGIVTDGRNGIIVSGHHPTDYATAILRLADPQLRASMSKANLEDAHSSFSVKSMAANYITLAESFARTQ